MKRPRRSLRPAQEGARRQASRTQTQRPPVELDQVEARIATLERQVADLEAEARRDWTNMDVLTAHRAARDELPAPLARWEELFEAAQGRSPGRSFGDGEAPGDQTAG